MMLKLINESILIVRTYVAYMSKSTYPDKMCQNSTFDALNLIWLLKDLLKSSVIYPVIHKYPDYNQ